MKLLIGIQARTNSTRLPGKILKVIGPKTVFSWVYDACVEAHRKLNAVPFTSEVYVLGQPGDIDLRKFCLNNSIKGLYPDVPGDDLIQRYLKAAEEIEATHVIRVTADCRQTNPVYSVKSL